jgi:sugar phosphate isomerase/epimerase
MTSPSRRNFLAAAIAASVPASARTLTAIGVQLYTVRKILPKDPLGVLRQIQEIGYKEVEVIPEDLDVTMSALKQTSLKPVSLHLDTELFLRKQDKLGAALEKAKSYGFQYVVCPYIDPKDRGGAEVMKKLGETLNKAGEQCAKIGLTMCYHNHAFEFAPSGSGILLDVLMQVTDPKLVSLELDMMWAQVAGVDPVSVLEKYGSRIKLMHLKDVVAMPKRYNEEIPASAFKEVGSGTIKVAQVLAAANKAGVEHYFVEQDETPGNPIGSLKKSYDYLASL